MSGCRRRILGRFGSSVSASCAGAHSRWLHHTFACAVRRCRRDGIPGVRLPGAAVSPRSRSLRTSRGPGGYAVTPALGGRGLHPHGKLSYKVHLNLAVFLGTKAPFRPTGRTSTHAELTLLCGRNCQALLSVFLSFFISISSLIVLNILYSAHTNNIHPRAGFSLPVPLSHAGPVPLLGRLLTDS
jgi:hypothetical protein